MAAVTSHISQSSSSTATTPTTSTKITSSQVSQKNIPPSFLEGSFVRPRPKAYEIEGGTSSLPSFIPEFCPKSRFFQVEGKRGEGGHSWVYETQHVPTGNIYAIKIPEVGTDKAYKRAVNEANTLITLNQRGVRHVPVLRDVFDISCASPTEKRCAIVTDFVADSSLRRYDKQLVVRNLAETRTITKQILESLADMKLVHADLTPYNILFCKALLQVTLIDFELTQNAGEDLGKSTITHLWYRAPELLFEWAPDGHVRSRCAVDIWSLGCLVFECLTGEGFANSSAEKEEDQLKEQLLLIAYRMGSFPSFDHISHSKQGQRFYKINEADHTVEGFRGYPIPNRPLHWKTSIERIARLHKWPEKDLTEVIEFLSGALQYDPAKRKPAAELLASPFLAQDLSLSLTLTLPAKTVLDHFAFRRFRCAPSMKGERKIEKPQTPASSSSFEGTPELILKLPAVTSKTCVHLPGKGDGSDVYEIQGISKEGAILMRNVIKVSKFSGGLFLHPKV